MTHRIRARPGIYVLALVLLAIVGSRDALGAGAARAHPAGGPGNGGVGIGIAPTGPPGEVPPPPGKHAKGRWLGGVTITEYWPAPEMWFTGRLVKAPGLTGRHHIDWLYSAMGLPMEGEGIGLDGRFYHLESAGRGGWVTSRGRPTSPSNGWSGGTPFWRAGAYWRNRRGAVTFPLAGGGWSAGRGRKYIPLPGVSFARGKSLPLRYYRSIAVDPSVIPLGSRVYVPAYSKDGHGGWFLAQDTGGAVSGDHIDVFRPPPPGPAGAGQTTTGARIYVIRPRR